MSAKFDIHAYSRSLARLRPAKIENATASLSVLRISRLTAKFRAGRFPPSAFTGQRRLIIKLCRAI